MSLINCDINPTLKWSANCVIFGVTEATFFEITDAKLYIPVAILSSQDQTELLDNYYHDLNKQLINTVNSESVFRSLD